MYGGVIPGPGKRLEILVEFVFQFFRGLHDESIGEFPRLLCIQPVQHAAQRRQVRGGQCYSILGPWIRSAEMAG